MTKMTYANAIDMAINGEVTEEVKEKLEALKVQLAKRNSGTRKPTKTQVENEALKERIAEFLRTTPDGIQCKVLAEKFGISVHKMSALLNQLYKEEVVEKWTEKRVLLWKAVDADAPQFLDDEVAI